MSRPKVDIDEFSIYQADGSPLPDVIYRSSDDLAAALSWAGIMPREIERSGTIAIVVNVDNEGYSKVLLEGGSIPVADEVELLDGAIAALCEARSRMAQLIKATA